MTFHSAFILLLLGLVFASSLTPNYQYLLEKESFNHVQTLYQQLQVKATPRRIYLENAEKKNVYFLDQALLSIAYAYKAFVLDQNTDILSLSGMNAFLRRNKQPLCELKGGVSACFVKCWKFLNEEGHDALYRSNLATQFLRDIESFEDSGFQAFAGVQCSRALAPNQPVAWDDKALYLSNLYLDGNSTHLASTDYYLILHEFMHLLSYESVGIMNYQENSKNQEDVEKLFFVMQFLNEGLTEFFTRLVAVRLGMGEGEVRKNSLHTVMTLMRRILHRTSPPCNYVSDLTEQSSMTVYEYPIRLVIQVVEDLSNQVSFVDLTESKESRKMKAIQLLAKAYFEGDNHAVLSIIQFIRSQYGSGVVGFESKLYSLLEYQNFFISSCKQVIVTLGELHSKGGLRYFVLPPSFSVSAKSNFSVIDSIRSFSEAMNAAPVARLLSGNGQ